MSLILSGSDGVSDIDGTVSTPAIRGTDANTGIFFPAADTIAFSEGGVESMRIDSSGNVLVGTTSLSGKIAIAGSGNQAINVQRTDASTTGAKVSFVGYDSSANAVAAMDYVADGADDSSYIRWRTRPTGGSLTERMRIDSSGNVGIGTSSPTNKLSLATTTNGGICLNVGSRPHFGATYSSDSLVLGYSVKPNPSTVDGMVGTETNSGGGAPAAILMNSGVIQFHTATSVTSGAAFSSERMRISSGGNLLVGTTSVPNAGTAISCFGNVYAFALNSGTNTWYQGTNGNEFNVYSADGVRRGYLTLAGTWTNTSDIAYKKDIVDIKYSLEDALKLRPVSYLTKDHDIPQIGFIAQEMEQVIPEVVSGEEGSKGISYGSLVALCVKAIQEQQTLIENLTTRLNALEGN